jgi:Na+/proline symporter
MTADSTSDPSMDGVDALLTGAFERALDSMSQIDVVDRVMNRIRTRQRQRMIILLGVGFVAAVICVVNGLPLIGIAAGTLSEVNLADWSTQLPVIFAVLAVVGGVLACFHLLVEEIA